MRRKIILYNPNLKELAKKLRKNMTLGEVLLWNELKQKRMLGYDFDRQKPIDNFIVDFYCKNLQLAIEVDGSSHDIDGVFEKDKLRQERLEELGVKFLRFDDEDVKKQMNGVVKEIECWIENNKKSKPTPNPSREGNQYE